MKLGPGGREYSLGGGNVRIGGFVSTRQVYPSLKQLPDLAPYFGAPSWLKDLDYENLARSLSISIVSILHEDNSTGWRTENRSRSGCLFG